MCCILALVYSLGAGFIRTKSLITPGEKLQAFDPWEPDISGSGFAPNAVFEQIQPHISGVDLYGSAVAGDSSTGQVQSRWYRPFPHFYLLISGFPVGHDCEIHLEVFTPNSAVAVVPIQFDENPEHWRLQRISLTAFPRAAKFRIVASDHSRNFMGWIGFSPPFTIPRSKDSDELWTQSLLLLCCLAACLVSVLGPGLAARCWFPKIRSLVWLPVPGVLMLALIGLFVWIGPEAWAPATIARTALPILFTLVAVSLLRRPLTSLLSSSEIRVFGVITLLIVIAAAKSSYSIGPSGELFRGTECHGLEPGTRSDSRISYHVVQLVAGRLSGTSPLAKNLFGPWTFSHRGPIAGLAAAPIVLCSKVAFPDLFPEKAWTLFDPEGFAAYRMAMIVMAAAALCFVYGVARLFLNSRWAMLAFLVVAGAPFTVHEMFFTWPKSLAAGFVLLAVYLGLKRRYFFAGLAVGAGYLCHPSALLCFPAILSLTLIRTGRITITHHLKSMLAACSGLFLCWAFWRQVNRGDFQQDSFFNYFRECYPLPFSAVNWLHSRLINFSMTLVPLNAFLFHRLDSEMLPTDHSPQPWVQFMHQDWSTLCFGAGIFFYFSLLRILSIAFTKAKAWTWLVIAPPFVLFLVYWGPGNTGLLREGLHAWVFGLLLFAVVIWKRCLSGSRTFWLCTTAALGMRGIETIAMLIPFSAWSRGYALQRPFQATDLLMLAIMVAGTAWLTWLTISACRSVSPQR